MQPSDSSGVAPRRRLHRHPALRWALLVLVVLFAYRFVAVYRIQRTCGGERQVAVLQRPLAARTPTQNLTVMSWNIQGHAALVRGDHIEEIARTINELRPDIVGIQEAHRFTWQARFRDHVVALARLTGMNIAFAPTYSVFGGEFGNAILTRGRITAARAEALPTVGEPRGVLIADVELDGRRVTFLATHLAAWRKLSGSTRADQIACLKRVMLGVKRPWILVGDLNDTADRPELRRLTADPSVGVASPPGVATHRVMQAAIDYIFHSRDLRLASGGVPQKGVSDHWPVVAEFMWK